MRLAGAAAALQAELGTPGSELSRRELARQLTPARRLLGDADYEAEWTAGRATSLAEAVAQVGGAAPDRSDKMP